MIMHLYHNYYMGSVTTTLVQLIKQNKFFIYLRSIGNYLVFLKWGLFGKFGLAENFV